MRGTVAVLLLGVLGLAGCKREDMYAQPKSVTWSDSEAFPQAMRMLHPVPHTEARDGPPQSAPQPVAITRTMLARGRDRFDIFCTPCHGRAGDGEGMVVRRSFPHPPQLWKPGLKEAKAAHFYDVITHGHGVMYSLAGRIPPADRWAIVAYVRALQRSQDSVVASLPPEERKRLAQASAEPVP